MKAGTEHDDLALAQRESLVLERTFGIPAKGRAEYARSIPDLNQLEDEMLENGQSVTAIATLIQELEAHRNVAVPPAVDLMRILRNSLEVPDSNSTMSRASEIEYSEKPRFQTSIAALNALTRGGYGLVSAGGDPKVGKTTFAIGPAVEASLDGWTVVYLNAELDDREAKLAVMRYCGGKIPDQVKKKLFIVNPDYTFQPRDAIERVGNALSPDDDKVLVVLDSINALVDLSSDGRRGEVLDYWSAHSLWRNFALRSVRASLGRIAFLVVSELNKDGQSPGAQLAYKSDMASAIQKEDSRDETVEIEVTHSRSTRAGHLGTFLREWEKGRFLRVAG